MNITTHQVIQHFLNVLLEKLQNEKVHELDSFFGDYFTKDEIIAMLQNVYGDSLEEHVKIDSQDNSELLTFLSDVDVLQFYMQRWKLDTQQSTALHPVEVMKTLEQLGLQTHYLASKAIAFWDEYDHSNYRSLQIKAGKIKRVYGIYDTMVKQQDVYQITSQPKRFFESYDLAKEKLQEFIDSGTFKEDEIHILYRYLSLS